MNRLTKRNEDIIYYTKGKYSPKTLSADMEPWEVRECMRKLSAYEETGLEPEDAKALYSANSNIVKFVMDNRELNNKYNTLLEMYDKLQNELKEYKDLEEQGRLHIAPVADGTDIYVSFYNDFEDTREILETKYLHGLSEFEFGEINKNWFLTREEAEKALEAANERN